MKIIPERSSIATHCFTVGAETPTSFEMDSYFSSCAVFAARSVLFSCSRLFRVSISGEKGFSSSRAFGFL